MRSGTALVIGVGIGLTAGGVVMYMGMTGRLDEPINNVKRGVRGLLDDPDLATPDDILGYGSKEVNVESGSEEVIIKTPTIEVSVRSRSKNSQDHEDSTETPSETAA
jgi:hypothetical protein